MNMDKKMLAVLALAAALISGCDWIRAKLDMPTSEDIARKKEMIAQKEAEKVVIAAATDTAQVADSVSVESKPEVTDNSGSLQLTPRSNLDKTYYIIVGAFKTDKLVEASLKSNAGILEAPFAFEGNGLKYVSIGGYETLEEARKALVQAHAKAPEAWVYKKR